MTLPPGSRRTWLRAWLPVLVWAGFIFLLSATPNLQFSQSSEIDLVVRKAGHMMVFGALAALIWRALARSAVRRAIAWSWLLTLAYAASDEFHQSFTVGRHMSPLDVAIDSLGALLVLAALAFWLRSRRNRSAAGRRDES